MTATPAPATGPDRSPSDAEIAEVTVLMPLWAGDSAERARAALASATVQQTLRPALLVLTVDGPVPEDLGRVVDEVESGRYGPARVLRHETHRGLAAVLQDGLLASPHDLIARADADDLCRPERLSLQVPVMREQGLDVLGGAMQEFSDRIPAGRGPLRTRPLTHEEIAAYLPTHSPFHHPTVMLRRSAVLAVGGYRHLDLLEDYWLWERLLLGGARMGNLPDVLVDYRVDELLFARRGGWRLFRSDLRLQRIMCHDGLIGPLGWARNLVMRAAYRFAPGWARRLGYRLLVERGRGDGGADPRS